MPSGSSSGRNTRAVTTEPWTYPETVRTDCRHFRGSVPCQPHKLHGVHCSDASGTACPHYAPTTEQILIIKLGAMGDVLRTTPLLRRLMQTHPQARFWWLTYTPQVIPACVDVVLTYTPQSIALLQAVEFDLLINLDKDPEACALASTLRSRDKKGYTLAGGVPAPVNADAAGKFMTGVFDDVSRANRATYLEEIFAIAGERFAGERYMLDPPADASPAWKLPRGKPIVGLNTGCGARWTSRLWPERNWVSLARRLRKAGAVPLLLGGEQEHVKNRRIARLSGARYAGFFPIGEFVRLVGACDLVVTGVTFAAHVAIGLGKRIVLFNNIFNRHEFELYGQGEILEPEAGCTCYYAPRCTNPAFAPKGCMTTLRVETVANACLRLLRP